MIPVRRKIKAIFNYKYLISHEMDILKAIRLFIFFSFHFNIMFIKENFLLLYTVLEIFIYNKDHLLVNYSCNMDEIHCRFFRLDRERVLSFGHLDPKNKNVQNLNPVLRVFVHGINV
jgi:hypothetical protein